MKNEKEKNPLRVRAGKVNLEKARLVYWGGRRPPTRTIRVTVESYEKFAADCDALGIASKDMVAEASKRISGV